MIRIASEHQLLDTFRSLDRDEVQLPPDMRFPVAARDYLSWIEPSGHRVYLVFEDQAAGGLKGIVFQRTHAGADTPAAMCQWCHSVRTGNGVSLLTAAAGRNTRIGVHLCSDLNCRERALSTPGIHDFNESISGQERVQRVLQRMGEFARKCLF
jgi:hypothetical protein